MKKVHWYMWAGGVLVALIAAILCIVICAEETMVIPTEADNRPTEVPAAVIVYADAGETDGGADTAGGRLIAAPTRRDDAYILTMYERDLFAGLVAGKAAGEPAGCQQAVATVLLNTLNACGGDVAAARKAYTWDDVQTPTDDTYDAVDAVFVRGERLLDDDVLWIGRAGQADTFHKRLEEVCTIGGVTFYREGARCAD